MIEGVKTGYKWYMNFLTRSGEILKQMSKMIWFRTHNRIFPKLNKSISSHHGIVNILNGPLNMDNPRNTLVFYWCDTLVITLRQYLGMDPPDVVIRSRGFNRIPDMVTNVCFPTDPNLPCSLNEEETDFVLCNADYYYHMYGLWQNNSNKSIRLEVRGIDCLTRSAVFTANEQFKSHQVGKFNSLKRRVHDDTTKTLYICH